MKKIILTILFCLFCFNIAIAKENNLEISSLAPKQGDAVIVKIKTSSPDEILAAEFLDKTYLFYSLNSQNEKYVIIPIGAKTIPQEYPLIIHSSNHPSFVEFLDVQDSHFPITSLTILKQKGYSKESIQKNNNIESQLLIDNNPITPYYFTGKFNYPLKQIKNVGAYGNIRNYQNVYLQHLGVDLFAKEWTPVYSINSGIVESVMEISNYGKTVVLDHGAGIKSIYLHLNKSIVKQGQVVKKNQFIAFSGNTGYSIAPHLHLSIKVYGKSINPLFFINEFNHFID